MGNAGFVQPSIFKFKSPDCSQSSTTLACAGVASEDANATTAINNKIRMRTRLCFPIAVKVYEAEKRESINACSGRFGLEAGTARKAPDRIWT